MKKVLLFAGVATFLIACSNTDATTEAGEAQEAAKATETSVSYNVNTTESIAFIMVFLTALLTSFTKFLFCFIKSAASS